MTTNLQDSTRQGRFNQEFL